MRLPSTKRPLKESGAVLMIIIFMIGVAITSFAVSSLSADWFKTHLVKKEAETLSSAKAALIGFVLSQVASGERPGNFPLPDYFASTETPKNYDGETDGCMDASKADGLPLVTNGANMHCSGRLPWKTIGMTIAKPSQNDPLGEVPWYAVSANLVDPTCLSVLNPSILNMTFTTYTCGSSSQLPHRWLTVRDSKGNILSNRVAFIIFYPGTPINTQIRESNPLNDITHYLDNISVPVDCLAPCVPGTYSNADLDYDFIIPEGYNDPYNGSINYANDKVLYVTIDELLPLLTKRVAGDARKLINTYKSNAGHFPYAALLGSSPNSFTSNNTDLSGHIPVDGTDLCSCTSATNCSCQYSLIDSVSHNRNTGGTYSTVSGSCSRSSRRCTCTGAGQCRNATSTIRFTCTSVGSCSFVGTGTLQTFTFTPKSAHLKAISASLGCAIVGSNVNCTSSGRFWLGFKDLPVWLTDNLWQEYFYYHISGGTNLLSIGSQTNIQALLIGTGAPIITTPYADNVKNNAIPTPVIQTTPSTDINDYLDSIENTNLDLVFEPSNKEQLNNYNDQVFKVAP